MSEQRESALPGLIDDSAILHRISEELTEKFTGIFAAETVERYVFESYTALAGTSRIHSFLAATTARFAADRLRPRVPLLMMVPRYSLFPFTTPVAHKWRQRC